LQALILAGGEGTRLRPLTSTIPKPVVPLVNRPFIAYMLEWLRGHGVDDAILSCGFMADGVRNVLGDGEALGMRIRYLEEPSPLGTGGALKFAEDWLDERFLMLNGDVLTDIDVSVQIRQHERSGARATLALIGVEDPSAYGLVRLENDHSVSEFLEKPSPDQIDTNLVNAGVYVLQRDVLDGMAPAGTKISIEREVFPTLVGHGLCGYRASGYWLDIGTPARYLQATYDILEERVHTLVGDDLRAAEMALISGAEVNGEIIPPVVAGAGTRVSSQATVGARTVLGAGVSVAAGAQIVDSVLLDGASVGDGSIVRGSIIGRGVRIGENCDIEGEVVLGEGVRIGSDNVLRHGARIFPGVELSSGAIKF
jgi:mannose-1-phosphate guanylyltransferase